MSANTQLNIGKALTSSDVRSSDSRVAPREGAYSNRGSASAKFRVATRADLIQEFLIVIKSSNIDRSPRNRKTLSSHRKPTQQHPGSHYFHVGLPNNP